MWGKVGADLSCRRQGGDNPLSTRLSRLDNRNLIIGCLKRQLCQGLREQTRHRFGVIVMEITAASEYHKAFPPKCHGTLFPNPKQFSSATYPSLHVHACVHAKSLHLCSTLCDSRTVAC